MVAAVRARGGLARSATLRREGHPQRAITAAIAGNRFRRFRRLWVATADVDPVVLAAVAAGGIVSCVTQARRLGLWAHTPEAVHIAAPPHAGQVTHAGPVHRSRPIVARHPDAVVDPIENVLALVASCLSYEQALAVWNSALDRRLADREVLARLPWRGNARLMLAECSPFHGSGLETFVDIRLRWLGLPIVAQAWLLGHRVDFLIGERLVLQIDGGTHVGAQRSRDIEHDAELLLRGFHVIRVGYDDVVHRWPAVQDRIMRAVAQGLHLAR